jgi:acyl carrier protein
VAIRGRQALAFRALEYKMLANQLSVRTSYQATMQPAFVPRLVNRRGQVMLHRGLGHLTAHAARLVLRFWRGNESTAGRAGLEGGRRAACPRGLTGLAGPAIELPHPLRYDGRSTPAADGAGRDALIRGHPRRICKQPDGRRNALSTKGLPMSSTFDAVANIIAETCDIPRDTIKPESHAINDLGIDSLDFLDVAFAIDKAFGIKMPLEQWTQEVNEGKATTEQYFVLKNLCTHIDELVAVKGA